MDNEEVAQQLKVYIEAFESDDIDTAMGILESASTELANAIFTFHTNLEELIPQEEETDMFTENTGSVYDISEHIQVTAYRDGTVEIEDFSIYSRVNRVSLDAKQVQQLLEILNGKKQTEQIQTLGKLLDVINNVDGAIAEATIDGKTVRVQYFLKDGMSRGTFNFFRDDPEDIRLTYEVDLEDMKKTFENAFGQHNPIENPLLVDQAIWRLVPQAEQ